MTVNDSVKVGEKEFEEEVVSNGVFFSSSFFICIEFWITRAVQVLCLI